MAYFTRDETEIIKAHRKDTTCYVLADTGTCLELKAQEVRRVTGRTLVPLTSARLPGTPPRSWMLAVVLCPGDDTKRLAAWALRLRPADQDRIDFYEPQALPQVDAVYGAWTEAGLPDPNRFPVDDLAHLNRLLGLDLNRRILRDHQPANP